MSDQYTLVQHSAYGFKGDTQFAQAVESRGVRTKADVTAVERAGGVVLASYLEAEDLVDKVNYPPDVTGLIPRAKGTFSLTKIDGLAVYVPVREIVG